MGKVDEKEAHMVKVGWNRRLYFEVRAGEVEKRCPVVLIGLGCCRLDGCDYCCSKLRLKLSGRSSGGSAVGVISAPNCSRSEAETC